ncbi:hypothetical protein GK047_18360 [Paenibacillus sp. SYP-B3998]|uniref:DUF1269 domain-containing protein n=1 Tax=Paenibacillus sp. SYP-B3998 TaxID=2678564 RepID=A0A6G4A0F5_9BACL|nr:hypothetical protein [Paenibacillus sp. SYP-B3998]NEW07966.1 hypothetical protein [Paenibacillus sp. SYP-B3998]
MHVVSSFDHSIYLELAITALEEVGISKEHIYAVPLRRRSEQVKMFDTIHSSDGVSLLDAGFALGTALAVVGSSYGFILKGGPILWGIIGAVVGFTVGVFLDGLRKKRNSKLSAGGKSTEVVVLVSCTNEEVKQVESIFWEHLALGVAVCD